MFKETKEKQFCYIDFKDNIEKNTIRIVIELYIGKCPKACENFMALCNGWFDP